MAALITTKFESNERREFKNEYSISDKISSSSKSYNFTIFDLAVLILSVFSIIIDLCTDLILVVQYSSQGYKDWAIGTFVLIFFPSIIVQFFSLRWHVVDKNAGVLHWVFHFCMLGIIYRYIDIIKAAFAAYKSKNSSEIEKVLLDQSDLCMLHLFESFLESAPQLVLQIYVTVVLHEWKIWTGVSVLASLLSLAWALAAYTKTQRQSRANKNLTTWPGLLLQAIWRTGMLTARISTLVLGAYCFGSYIFLIVTVHWIAMILWIIYQKTDFCETFWEEKIYNAVVAVIYCFCFFNLQEGQSRLRALIFYLIIVFQNLTCLTIFLMWFGDKTPKLAISGFIAIVSGTILGSISMLLYYRFFHPSGPIRFILTPQLPRSNDQSYSSVTLRSLKRIRLETQSKDLQQNSPTDLNKSSLSESVVILEENVLDETDVDLKILEDWINEGNDKKPTATVFKKNETNEAEIDIYKRRAICSSVDLVRLLESKAEAEIGSLKLTGTDEASSEILSAHDYENLCAVNIAREAWGLRSWQGYSDIETWLHDDSVVHDQRLDTLTSTTSSDRSANTFQKESERTRQDDYLDAIAEDLVQCELELNTEDNLNQDSIESLPHVYSLGPLDPIFEEIEDASNNSADFGDLKTSNGSESTLVATIEEIRRNTPIPNRYPSLDSSYDNFSPLSDIKPKQQRNWKRVTFASKLLTFPGNNFEQASEITKKSKEEEGKAETVGNGKPEKAEIAARAKFLKSTASETHTLIKEDIKSINKEKSKVQISNKENILTVTNKINHWNKLLSSQTEKKVIKDKIVPPERGTIMV